MQENVTGKIAINKINMVYNFMEIKSSERKQKRIYSV